MDYTQLIETRKNKVQELENIVNAGKAEQRKLSAVENSALENVKKELENLDKEIEQKRNNKNNTIIIKNNRMENRFSLLKSIRNIVEGRNYDDTTLAILEAGKKDMAAAGLSYRGQLAIPYEYRAAIVAGTDNSGQDAIAEDKFDMIGPLRANLVALKAGGTLLTGLVGDVSIPTYAGSSALWKGETDAATDGAGATGEITMSPKRLTTYIDISKQFLVQDSVGAEALLMKDLNDAIMAKLEATIFGITGSTTIPSGFYYSPTYNASATGATSFTKVVALESAIDTSNALTGNLAYITHPTLKGKHKVTSKDTGSGLFIQDGNTANGYPVYVTSHMSSSLLTDHYGIIFGNWADLLVGSWGAIDLTVDPYTQAVNGKVRIIVNSYWDVAKRRTASFSIGALK